MGCCGFCGPAGHCSQDCSTKDDRNTHRCVLCGKPEHTSWARECLVRKAQVERAQQAYATRPCRFQVQGPTALKPQTAPTTSQGTTEYPSAQASPDLSQGPVLAITALSASLEVPSPFEQNGMDDIVHATPMQSVQITDARKRKARADSGSEEVPGPLAVAVSRRRGRPSIYNLPAEAPPGSQDIRNMMIQDTQLSSSYNEW